MDNKQLGAIGEKHAAEYLKSKNYKILQLNFTCRYGEIDIIAKHKKSIVFVEVKTRRSTNFGKGMEAVNFYKQQKLRKVALYYLNKNAHIFSDIRFDVIDILIQNECEIRIEHIENAF
ncbi:MAG: YraN family protein [Thermoanaerobacteraceae bacterium]|nr:YraN family protein [Thermoanaerobacteraceae bacterium]